MKTLVLVDRPFETREYPTWEIDGFPLEKDLLEWDSIWIIPQKTPYLEAGVDIALRDILNLEAQVMTYSEYKKDAPDEKNPVSIEEFMDAVTKTPLTAMALSSPRSCDVVDAMINKLLVKRGNIMELSFIFLDLVDRREDSDVDTQFLPALEKVADELALLPNIYVVEIFATRIYPPGQAPGQGQPRDLAMLDRRKKRCTDVLVSLFKQNKHLAKLTMYDLAFFELGVREAKILMPLIFDTYHRVIEAKFARADVMKDISKMGVAEEQILNNVTLVDLDLLPGRPGTTANFWDIYTSGTTIEKVVAANRKHTLDLVWGLPTVVREVNLLTFPAGHDETREYYLWGDGEGPEEPTGYTVLHPEEAWEASPSAETVDLNEEYFREALVTAKFSYSEKHVVRDGIRRAVQEFRIRRLVFRSYPLDKIVAFLQQLRRRKSYDEKRYPTDDPTERIDKIIVINYTPPTRGSSVSELDLIAEISGEWPNVVRLDLITEEDLSIRKLKKQARTCRYSDDSGDSGDSDDDDDSDEDIPLDALLGRPQDPKKRNIGGGASDAKFSGETGGNWYTKEKIGDYFRITISNTDAGVREAFEKTRAAEIGTVGAAHQETPKEVVLPKVEAPVPPTPSAPSEPSDAVPVHVEPSAASAQSAKTANPAFAEAEMHLETIEHVSGIMDSAQKTGRVTTAQFQVVSNILATRGKLFLASMGLSNTEPLQQGSADA